MKKWYQSKTIWGVVIAAAGTIIGYPVTETDIQDVLTAAGKVAEAFGLILALYGRIKAEDVIK